ncbi:cupin domain-containing protein [Paenibacillus harenae]|uniref:cupin domain-containing protein n=1 Tax=Paenibacillus harenae TaxID=306543 RepID=UPI001FDF034A|nr:cupin domain-containing protein [Paenibacillus harenae]
MHKQNDKSSQQGDRDHSSSTSPPTLQDLLAAPLSARLLAPSGSDLIMAEWTAEGTPEGNEPMLIAPLHLHAEDDEAWYVIEGTLGFRIGDNSFEAGAGSAVAAPRGTPHTYWNPKPEEARYLIIMTAQIHSLIQAIHASSSRDAETIRALFERHGAVLLETP